MNPADYLQQGLTGEPPKEYKDQIDSLTTLEELRNYKAILQANLMTAIYGTNQSISDEESLHLVQAKFYINKRIKALQASLKPLPPIPYN